MRNNIFIYIIVSAVFFTTDAKSEINFIGNPTPLEFGTIVKPSVGIATISMDQYGYLSSSDTVVLDPNGVIGELRIREKSKSNAQNNVKIDIEYSECAGNSSMGIGLRNPRSKYGSTIFSGNGYGLDNPGRGSGTTLNYIADIRVSSTAQIGDLNPCYTITVLYSYQ